MNSIILLREQKRQASVLGVRMFASLLCFLAFLGRTGVELELPSTTGKVIRRRADEASRKTPHGWRFGVDVDFTYCSSWCGKICPLPRRDRDIKGSR